MQITCSLLFLHKLHTDLSEVIVIMDSENKW